MLQGIYILSLSVIKSEFGYQCHQAECNLILTNAGHGDSSHTELGEIFFVFFVLFPLLTDIALLCCEYDQQIVQIPGKASPGCV